MQYYYNKMKEMFGITHHKSQKIDGDPVVFQKSSMEQLSKGIYIWNSDVNEDLVQLRKYCE